MEARFTTLKRDIYQLWDDTLKNSITNDAKLIVGNQNNSKLSQRHLNRKSKLPKETNKNHNQL